MSVYSALLCAAVSVQRTGLSALFRLSGGRDGRPERDRRQDAPAVAGGKRETSGCGACDRACDRGAAGEFYKGRDKNE